MRTLFATGFRSARLGQFDWGSLVSSVITEGTKGAFDYYSAREKAEAEEEKRKAEEARRAAEEAKAAAAREAATAAGTVASALNPTILGIPQQYVILGGLGLAALGVGIAIMKA